MPSRASTGAVDTRREASVPPAPLDEVQEGQQPGARRRGSGASGDSTDPSNDQVRPRDRRRRPRLIVEGVRPGVGQDQADAAGHLGGMPDYPVQVSKVQAPPLRDETLARDRLLEWLSVKIHRRTVLLIAEAGYGKTTLLADFSRRTRVRVLWFRLDRGDRDWVGFLAYLVAGVRIHVPEFGAATSSLLRETATSAPSLETVLDTFLRELGGLPHDASALVFDDFHLVDDSPDVRLIIRELLARGPERMSFVFASRREPPIRLARLRALGEVAELATDDLRFDAAETERLFRETYSMRLEPSVLAELGRRTEGWAASLQLVRAALHDRNASQVRSFISSLSGAEGHLYEYLAEEVVGDLPGELQDFLMRTSLLETVDLVLGPVAAGVSEEQARALIEEGERHGLFGRGGPHTRHVARAHPLVRDFLQARLTRVIGPHGVREIHLKIAKAAEGLYWQQATRHYISAGAEEDAQRVLSAALERIMATGAYAAAHELAVAMTESAPEPVTALILQSRIALQRGASQETVDLAEQAWELSRDSSPALMNLATARSIAGDIAGAIEASKVLGRSGQSPLANIGRAYQRTMETSVEGSLPVAASELEALIGPLRSRGDGHFLGVAYLNLSFVRGAMGQHTEALAAADEAVGLLSLTSAGIELISARLARGAALAYLGRMAEARQEMARAEQGAPTGRMIELAHEIGQIEALLGEPPYGWPLLNRVAGEVTSETDEGEQAILARALLRLREDDLKNARKDVAQLRFGVPRTAMAFEARRHLLKGLVLALEGEPTAPQVIEQGSQLASNQGSEIWARYGHTLKALINQDEDPSGAINWVAQDRPVILSMLAEVVLRRLHELTPEARSAIESEANRRPWRWRDPARRCLASGSSGSRQQCALLLVQIGEREDVDLLREAGRAMRDRAVGSLGVELARRLADRVVVQDLGRVSMSVGPRTIEGVAIRRKVLALLCLLLTKPRLVSTRGSD
jgi:LuxR family transcriptional regulator, maltose regulon positive regulatory protein